MVQLIGLESAYYDIVYKILSLHVLQLTKRVSALSTTVGDTSCQIQAVIKR